LKRQINIPYLQIGSRKRNPEVPIKRGQNHDGGYKKPTKNTSEKENDFFSTKQWGPANDRGGGKKRAMRGHRRVGEWHQG